MIYLFHIFVSAFLISDIINNKHFAPYLKPKNFKKGEYIVMPGQIQKNLYFVKSGIQMSYYENDGKQHVVAFTYSPGICAIPDSFMFQKPAGYSLVCVTDSEMESISFDHLMHIFDESREIERMFRIMTEQILAGVISRHIELQSLSIEKRFLNFAQRSPHLLSQVPHKYIASYLGIDPTNFSKLYNSVKI